REKRKPKRPKKEKPESPKEGEPKNLKKKKSKSLKKGKPKRPKKRKRKILKVIIRLPEAEKTEISEDPAEMEKNLALRFDIYESSQKDVAQVVSCWDRVRGIVQLPVNHRGDKSQAPAKNQGQKKTDKPSEKVQKKPVKKREDGRNLQSSQLEGKVAEGAVRDQHVGVPCLDIHVTNREDMTRMILESNMLPTAEQMLEFLGLGPSGPPIPPAVTFSVVNYPEERPSPDAKDQPKKGKSSSKDKSSNKEQISAQSTPNPQDPSAANPRSPSKAKKSKLQSASTPTEPHRPKQCRWIVPAHGEVELKVLFRTKKPGKFEETLRFEILGTKRVYELPCSGTGLYPSISQNPQLVFPRWRKTMEDDEIIFKEYVQSTNQFHFGPLLCGKSREWYVLPAPE
ncbi:HYDIN protein, partial [Climacteris rufus]|nr:HYDIN protein [Climacteris rufus]